MSSPFFPLSLPARKTTHPAFSLPNRPHVLTHYYRKDTKYYSLGEDPVAYFYLSAKQSYPTVMTFHVAARGDAESVLHLTEQEVAALDPDLPVFDTRTMREQMKVALLPVNLGASVVGTFGLLALVLSVVGLYGLLSYLARQRAQELGIRITLGARERDVVKLLTFQGVRIALPGIVVGLLLALLSTGGLSRWLYGVEATDPAIFAVVPGLLLVVVCAAGFVPALRALKTPVSTALRSE